MLDLSSHRHRAIKRTILPPRSEQPRVSVLDQKRAHTLEVNSNTLGLCALHQPGAVCTKTANPETGPCRCRRRAERTCFTSARPRNTPKSPFKCVEITHGERECCVLSSPVDVRPSRGAARSSSVPAVMRANGCGLCCLHGLPEIWDTHSGDGGNVQALGGPQHNVHVKKLRLSWDT